MKKILFILFLSSSLFAQFKDAGETDLNIKQSILNQNPSGFLFNILDPNKFNMTHSLSMSYGAFGNNGIALSVYTNSIFYEFNKDLNIEVETSFVNSPYNTMGDNFSKMINGVYLSKAQLNYRINKNTHLMIQYSNSPMGYGYGFGRFGRSGFGFPRGY